MRTIWWYVAVDEVAAILKVAYPDSTIATRKQLAIVIVDAVAPVLAPEKRP